MALEFREGGSRVIQANLPRIDPDRDVEIWICNDILHIRARRIAGPEPAREHSDSQYGVFSKDIALPVGSAETSVSATYSGETLEVRVPDGDSRQVTSIRIPVTRT